jgi:hypothetical protein
MKKLSLSILIVFALAVGVFMVRAQDGGTTTPRESYSILVPADATVTPSSDYVGFEIVGPEVNVRPVDMDFSRSGPAYHFGVRTYDNPDQLSSEEIARQTLFNLWHNFAAAQGPNPLPILDDGTIDEGRVSAMTVAGYDAFQILYFGGDHDGAEVTIAQGDQVVVFGYSINIPQNDPLAPMQLELAYMIMNTLQFDEK